MNQIISEYRMLDIENLLGCAIPSKSQLTLLETQLEKLLPLAPVCHSVVACNHLAAHCLFGWQSSGRMILRSGENGADLALLESEDFDFIADRYQKVVIGSGDGIFSHCANFLVQKGLEVVVVSRSGSLSKTLARVASRVVLLPELYIPTPLEMELAA
jgi:hypothetical protein